jgi:hydrogenase large subunit
VGYATNHAPTKKYLDQALETTSAVAKTKVGPAALHGTLGRHLARAVRASVLADMALKHTQLLSDNVAKGDLATFNEPKFPSGEIEGFGFHEAPRGTLSHWTVIRDGRIENYQAVVPTTWNAGPRDDKGRPGPYEASLKGNPVADSARPLEVLRTVHSFDPCLACAVHTLDVEKQGPATVVKVL